MRLASLLAVLKDDELDRLAVEHVRTDEKLARPQLCNFLEGALRSYQFVNSFVTNRQPPTFALLTLLLDAPGYELPIEGFDGRVMEETKHLTELIDAGELVGRDHQLRIYRRALFEARRNDLALDSSETAILAVLRRECGIAQVEHFLIEHHQDLREFWDKEDCLQHEQNALLAAGLIFVRDGRIVIPEELAPAISQTLGIDMPTDGARRLLGYLSSSELAAALEQTGSRTTGSKEARTERILTERIQPRMVLRSVGLPTLKGICREAGASVTGNKDDLVERIIGHFTQGKDQEADQPVEAPSTEERRLDEGRFEMLFGFLLHHELSDILRRFSDLRQTGTKEVRIRTLWQAHLSEETLLSELMNRDLESILQRLGLRLSGSKRERVYRVVEHFAGVADVEIEAPDSDGAAHLDTVPLPVSREMLMLQELFRQKASSPQSSLQPWMEDILDARGAVRCYATEDANPSKQLKNKLSQAAAAQGGVLVLILADEDAFLKTHEALLQRWLTNDEWPKSVACVALAYPLGSPAIEAIIERTDSLWPTRICDRLFKSAKVSRAIGETRASEPNYGPTTIRAICKQCGRDLPMAARFCPHCGTRTSD